MIILHSVLITHMVSTLLTSAHKEISKNLMPTYKQYKCAIFKFLFAMP